MDQDLYKTNIVETADGYHARAKALGFDGIDDLLTKIESGEVPSKAAELVTHWTRIHNKPMPWRKSVVVYGVLNKLSAIEVDRLIALDN